MCFFGTSNLSSVNFFYFLFVYSALSPFAFLLRHLADLSTSASHSHLQRASTQPVCQHQVVTEIISAPDLTSSYA